MELRQFRYFVVTSETRNLTKAANQLHIAQSALSHSIKNLETEIGTQLFYRSRKGMELTEAGSAFLEHAQVILQQVNKAKSAAQETVNNPHGIVRIAIVVSAGSVLTVPVYRMLDEKFPNIQLLHEEGLSGNLMHSFEAGLIDLMVETDAIESKHFIKEPLIREDLYLVSPYSEDEADNCEIDFHELPNYPLFLPGQQHGMGRTLHRYAHEYGIRFSTVRHMAATRPILQLIREGFGNVTLPWSAIHEMIELKWISARKIVNPSIQRNISIITPLIRPRSHATSIVEEIIRQATKEVHAEGKWHGELLVE